MFLYEFYFKILQRYYDILQCEKEISEFSFRGIKTYETNICDPLFVFNFDKRKMIIDKPIYL